VPVLTDTFPAVQFVHSEAPVPANALPSVQRWQIVLPMSGSKNPAAQLRHCARPVEPANLPAPQAPQDELPGALVAFPVGQGVHSSIAPS
jgi:hypothetical protein